MPAGLPSASGAPSAAGTAPQLRPARLPDFPWDSLAAAKERAASHRDGLVDLSMGTPVDSTPEFVQAALRASSDSPGYPTVWGTPELRAAIRGYLQRRWQSVALDDGCVLPTVGSKELVATLAVQLGVQPGSAVLGPSVAYPTYAIGALLAGADYVADDSTVAVGPRRVALVWVNSPANPTGRVLPAEHLRKVIAWARERGAIVAADECYGEYAWDAEPVSVLDPAVNGGSLDSVLAVHSLSKRSNLAGYRAAFVAGDLRLLSVLREVRRHSGLMVAAPVQAAMRAALDDDDHVAEQRERYARRRTVLLASLRAAGLRVDASEGSLYLWTTRDEPAAATVNWFADRGILVAPGTFYGPGGARHVRIALTATDERIESAAARLAIP